MFGAVEAPVQRLVRVRIGPVRIDGLRSGVVRQLKAPEIRGLGARAPGKSRPPGGGRSRGDEHAAFGVSGARSPLMGFLRRLLGNDGASVPDWAPFDTAKDYERVHRRRLGRPAPARHDRRGRGRRGPRPAAGRRRAAPARPANLSQLCHAAEPDDWSRIIASHFTSLLSMQGRDLDALAADYDQVKPILRVRLMPDESMGGVELPQSVDATGRARDPGRPRVRLPRFDRDGRCRPSRRLAGRCRWRLRAGARQPGVRADAAARGGRCRGGQPDRLVRRQLLRRDAGPPPGRRPARPARRTRSSPSRTGTR